MSDLFSQEEDFEDLELKKLPIGIQDFEILRGDGYLYVDKTQHLFRLIQTGKSYFLSRPRRFGKSLMLSTLEAIFKGRKDLFENTWILNSPEAMSYDWKEYPVIRIDMGKISHKTPGDFAFALKQRVLEIADEYQVNLRAQITDAADAVDQLITELFKLKKIKVVVLIDEYDKPILDHILAIEKADEIREVLRSFYGIFKSQDGNLQFLLLTGVTKFSKVSIFSGLNHPDDLTLTDVSSGLLGYTQEELELNFMPYIKNLARKFSSTVQEQLEQIKTWYNGYKFSGEGVSVYNPFSVLRLFQHQQYRAHWFETGTPTFLMKLIKTEAFNISDLNQLRVTNDELNMSDISKMELVALLYQTGYLTIKSYDSALMAYDLDYPNLEVKTAFSNSLLAEFSEAPAGKQVTLYIHMMEGIKTGNYEKLFEALKIFLASIPYTHSAKMTERDFQTVLFLLFTLMGYRMGLEVHTNQGRFDAILEFKDQICIFEYKINQSAKKAMKQIKDKKYYEPYLNLNKKIHLFGINFSVKERNINQWAHEKI